jgi:sigma-B regulation protein RsbU (phosphoserine phosphatase)
MSQHNEQLMFVTLFIGCLDLKTGRLDFCNCGHNPPVLVAPDGKPSFLPVKSNIAAGLVENFPYEAESIDLAPGTRIVAYTDGVTEAENDQLVLFGEDRLMKDIGLLDPGMDEQAVVEHVYHAVKDFTANHPQSDDITIMSLKV